MGKVKNADERVGSDLLQGHVAPLTEKGSDLFSCRTRIKNESATASPSWPAALPSPIPCLNFFFSFFFQVLNVYLF